MPVQSPCSAANSCNHKAPLVLNPDSADPIIRHPKAQTERYSRPPGFRALTAQGISGLRTRGEPESKLWASGLWLRVVRPCLAERFPLNTCVYRYRGMQTDMSYVYVSLSPGLRCGGSLPLSLVCCFVGNSSHWGLLCRGACWLRCSDDGYLHFLKDIEIRRLALWIL